MACVILVGAFANRGLRLSINWTLGEERSAAVRTHSAVVVEVRILECNWLLRSEQSKQWMRKLRRVTCLAGNLPKSRRGNSRTSHKTTTKHYRRSTKYMYFRWMGQELLGCSTACGCTALPRDVGVDSFLKQGGTGRLVRRRRQGLAPLSHGRRGNCLRP